MSLLPKTKKGARAAKATPGTSFLKQLRIYATDTEIPYLPKNSCTRSHDVYEVLKAIHEQQDESDLVEYFYALFLNRANKPIGFSLVSKGGMTSTIADPRIIMRNALLSSAASIIVCHNHPSGSLRPSRADEELTKKMVEAAKYFDMRVLDHIILGEGGYYSFADEGLI